MMRSNWVTVKPTYTSSADNSKMIEKIKEQIEWYNQNASRKEDDYIKANLKLIKNLTENVENSEDIIFIEKIIGTFCEIIETQRDVIRELEMVDFQPDTYVASQQHFVTSCVAPAAQLSSDDRIKAALTDYMVKEGRSPATTTDYISRIQNLWQEYVIAYRTGKLNEKLLHMVPEDSITPESPMSSAYHHIEAMKQYVAQNMAESEGSKNLANLANVRAALNTFGKALYGESYQKMKTGREEKTVKDYTKYRFMGKTYGKSRLVLAVVKQYVEDNQSATFEKLNEAFPDELQGSLGIVRRIEDVSDKYKGNGGVKRYFVGENEIIHLNSGEQVIVCTQWGASRIEEFIKNAFYGLGYEISKIEK